VVAGMQKATPRNGRDIPSTRDKQGLAHLTDIMVR
jgi:hypothetical protein